MQKSLFVLVVCILSACASNTVQETALSPSDSGHWQEPVAGVPQAFYLLVQVDDKMSSTALSAYSAKAAGELCAEKNFSYFDLAPMQGYRPAEHTIGMRNLVLCFAAMERPSLAAELKASANGLLVLTAGGALKKGDILLSMAGQPLSTLADLKLALHVQALAGKKQVNALVKRGKKQEKIKLAYIWSKAVFGPEDLERFRRQ